MRRFVGLLFLSFLALPLGLSVAGCGHGTAVVYCNGSGFGPTTGQAAHITLAANLASSGESLNYGQIGTALSASAEDCDGNAVSVSSFTYATSDMTVADVNPANGAVCGGTWNRNTGGGIGNFTVCTPPVKPTAHTAFITASADGATSNSIEVYIHPIVTAVVLGAPTASCTTSNDIGTDCCPANTTGTGTGTNITANAYNSNSCLSQNTTGRLVARVYSNGSTSPADNITCQVGPLGYTLQGSTNIATIDANGVVTANQPGSALVTATVSNSSSAVNAGIVSTCPPASIVLTAVNQPANASSINVSLNTPQTFTATVLDTNKTALNNYQGNPITGLDLEFNSTLPVNFPAASGAVTAAFPGSATITAVCQPPTCNPAPFSQIGFLGNGKPVTSNGILVNAAGTVSTVLYMGSTNSQYLASEDFTTGTLGAPVKLPFVPNSMVISEDGSTIYMGSPGGLMVLNTASDALTGTYQTVQGSVLAVAPNNSYAVITDPTRQTVSLVTSTGTVFSTFNGVGTTAQWSPDSTTLYVTTNTDQLLTYSSFVGWESTTSDEVYSDVAVAVPAIGAYFAGPNFTEIRSYCAATTTSTSSTPATTSNIFTPLSQEQAIPTNILTATTDGQHLLAATAPSDAAPAATLTDFSLSYPAIPASQPNGPGVCSTIPGTATFSATPAAHPLTGVTAATVTGVVAASNSSTAAVTYTGSGGVLPLYAPATGTLTSVSLSGGATTAPVAGVFSTDNSTFYAGTSGDNDVHLVTVTGSAPRDSGTINPALPAASGTGLATPNLIVQRPRRTTS